MLCVHFILVVASSLNHPSKRMMVFDVVNLLSRLKMVVKYQMLNHENSFKSAYLSFFPPLGDGLDKFTCGMAWSYISRIPTAEAAKATLLDPASAYPLLFHSCK